MYKIRYNEDLEWHNIKRKTQFNDHTDKLLILRMGEKIFNKDLNAEASLLKSATHNWKLYFRIVKKVIK